MKKTIDIWSAVGKGSRFSLSFSALSEKEHRAYEEAQPRVFTEDDSELFGNERIAFVDDEPELCNVVTALLRRYGYHATSFTDPAEFLETFRESPDTVDLVVTDVSMPHVRGDHLAREVKTIRNSIPIILCTGYASQVNEKMVRAGDFSALLYKPYDVSALTRTIRNLLDGGL